MCLNSQFFLLSMLMIFNLIFRVIVFKVSKFYTLKPFPLISKFLP